MSKKETKMGRKPKDGVVRETVISLKLSVEEVERINNLAKYIDLPKTVLMRNLILSGLSDAEILKKAGVLSLAKGIQKTSEFLKTYREIKESEKS